MPTSRSEKPARRAGRKLWVLDVTSDLGVPTYVAILHWMQDGKENIEFGSGAHSIRAFPCCGADRAQSIPVIGLMGGGSGEKSSLDGDTPLRLEDHPFLLPNGNRRSHPMPARRCARQHARPGARLRRYREACRAGFPRPRPDAADIETPVVRVIVPGLRHFYIRFAPGRLYDVPVKLGYLDQPLTEDEFTQFLPHT